MFRLGKLTDYAIVLIALIAGSKGAVITARGLSAATQIPWPTVVRLLKRLTTQGLLSSVRGRAGGYTLSRPPAKISLVEIIEAIEGPIALTECNQATGHCGIQNNCRVQGHWQVINHAVRQSLAAITLAELSGSGLAVTGMTRRQRLKEVV